MDASLLEKFEGVENIDEAYEALADYCYGLDLATQRGAKNIFFAWLYAISPVAFQEFVIEKEKIGDIYTPGIADAIADFHYLVDYLPQVLVPLRVSYEELADSNRAPAGLREAYLNYARDVYEFFRSPEDRKWSPAMMKYVTVVITDGGRILGLGDQGFNGSWITAGKQRCYFLGSGGAMLPQFAIPLGIDVGTDNEKLSKNPDYKGSKAVRLKGSQYYDFMHFVLRTLDEAGVAMIQFEDFPGEEAWQLLNWSRKNLKTPVFNDDIEGTASMLMTGILSAEKLEGIDLAKSLFFFCGAGGAASGIKQQLKWYLKVKGVKKPGNFFFTDSRGALYINRKVKVAEGKKTEFNKFQEDLNMVLQGGRGRKLEKYMKAHGRHEFGEASFEDLIVCFGDQLGENGSIFLIGTGTVTGGISPEAVGLAREAINKNSPGKKLVIFGLSNPTEKTDFFTFKESQAFLKAETDEARQAVLQGRIQEIYEACQGKVLLATGSPWGAFQLEDGKELIVSQANNILIFPAVGLALRLVGARNVSQKAWQDIWMTASEVLSQWFINNDSERREKGALLPTVEQVQEISQAIALAVAKRIGDFQHLAGGRLKRIIPEDLVAKVKKAALAAGAYARSAKTTDFIRD